MKVRLYNKVAKKGIAKLEEYRYEVSDQFEDYDAILVRSAKLHDLDFPNSLKCIARAGAGVNNIPLEKCSEQGIVVFNTPGANANAVKELTVAGLLLASRGIVQGISWVKSIADEEGLEQMVEKGKANFAGVELAGKKLGVIGLGAIGVKVANIAAALDMEVYGYDPYISLQAAWTLKARIQHSKDVQQIFEECDYISIHMPYNEQTKNFIDEAAFAKMKKGVRILNFSRNGLIEEQSLCKALDEGIVSAYVSDFVSKALLQYEQVITLPHLGASTQESEENCACMAVSQLHEYLEHGNIVNSVNMPSVDIPQTTKYRICIINKNVPDMIGSMSKNLSSVGINIENMFSKGRGNYAYTILETNDFIEEEVIQKIQASEGIISARVIVR